MVREEFLELLRADPAFREEVRRLLLTEELLAVPGKLDPLTEVVAQISALLPQAGAIFKDLAEAQWQAKDELRRRGEQVDNLIQVQRQTEERMSELVEAQRRTEERMGELVEAQRRTEEMLRQQAEQMQGLIKAQERTEEALRRLVDWQWGEDGRRKGQDYERDTIRRAPALFNGGKGGSADQSWVQRQLTEYLEPLLEDGWTERKDDPFLADLFWWKGDQLAVVEISLQVNGYDVDRAARRAAILKRAGVQTIAVVIGEAWANDEAAMHALDQRVEWKVGYDLSKGFMDFRRLPAK